MTLNSLQFWFLFPIVFSIYWLIPAKFNMMRKLFLVIVSYLLYMNWKPVFALVLLFVTLITYSGGLLFDRQTDKHRRLNLVWLFVFLGLLPLLTFKYYNFVNDSLSACLAFAGLKFSLPGLNWAIPVGISFFTFQAVGYMLDVYHHRTLSEKNILDYILFVSFFPQVTSGPISQANELLPQIRKIHRFDYEQGKQGLKYILWGMFMKLVVADRCGIFVDTVYGNFIHFNGTTCFVASVLYSIQIYCDFAGYTLMAIGLAKTLGFDLTDNFRRPYLALSIADFWKRWHISLTRWLTRHVYMPLGGNRCSKAKCYLNIMITFLVSGIWHGANWTFVLWGAIHGLLLMIEKSFGLQKYNGNSLFVCLGRTFLSFILVNFAWVFFRMPSVGDSCRVIARMFSNFGVPELSVMENTPLFMLFVGLALLVIKELREEFFHDKFTFLDTKIVRFAMFVLIFCLILSFGVLDGGQFIYASF